MAKREQNKRLTCLEVKVILIKGNNIETIVYRKPKSSREVKKPKCQILYK